MTEPDLNSHFSMTFTPNTIEHLGVRMYSTIPPVLAELIANAYDADASKVTVHLIDGEKKEITVSDDGHGMTADDINTKFLRIGRNRREEETSEVTPNGRKVIGKKGVGKLSFFGVAHEIQVETVKSGLRNTFVLEWEAIIRHDNDRDPGDQTDYSPRVIEYNADASGQPSGTTITLRSIQRESDFDGEAIADSLSKIFIVDPSFNIIIQHNNDTPIIIDNDRKYASLNIEIEWSVPSDIKPNEYLLKKGIKGYLLATEKPISPKTNMRGIALFSRNKLVNTPDYFSESTSSHFFSYLSGYLEVDFIDDLPDDVIGTNRQSLDWKHPETSELHEELRKIISWLERDWRQKRAEKRKEDVTKATGIQIDSWLNTMPDEISSKVKPIVQALVQDSELPAEVNRKVVRDFHELVPEYPRYHWRHLHPEIRNATKRYYESGDYYTAFTEAVKRYIGAVKAKAQITEEMDDCIMMETVFKVSDPILSVTEDYKKSDGTSFDARLLRNIKNAQQRFSSGVVLGGRNVTTHEEIRELQETNLFSENDCLDLLSLLSHLYHRLDKAVKVK